MIETTLTHLLKHNNWANLQLLAACEALRDEQLDAKPSAATHGTVRETLHHFILSQEDYVSMLTTLDHPPEKAKEPTLSDLREIVEQTGQLLIDYVQNQPSQATQSHLQQLTDGYQVAPWLFFVQLINHATEHREQIKSMMSALGLEPPRIDGWMYGRLENGLIEPAA